MLDPPTSASRVLGLQARATTPSYLLMLDPRRMPCRRLNTVTLTWQAVRSSGELWAWQWDDQSFSPVHVSRSIGRERALAGLCEEGVHRAAAEEWRWAARENSYREWKGKTGQQCCGSTRENQSRYFWVQWLGGQQLLTAETEEQKEGSPGSGHTSLPQVGNNLRPFLCFPSSSFVFIQKQKIMRYGNFPGKF
jgi:hypothetical protein